MILQLVEVHLYAQSSPVEIRGEIRNTYQKGDMYCVMETNGTVHKFPLIHIFRVREYPNGKSKGKAR